MTGRLRARFELLDDHLDNVKTCRRQQELFLRHGGQGLERRHELIGVRLVDPKELPAVVAEHEPRHRSERIYREKHLPKTNLPLSRIIPRCVPLAEESPAQHLAEVGSGRVQRELQRRGLILRVRGDGVQVVIEEREGLRGAIERHAHGTADVLTARGRELGDGRRRERFGEPCTETVTDLRGSVRAVSVRLAVRRHRLGRYHRTRTKRRLSRLLVAAVLSRHAPLFSRCSDRGSKQCGHLACAARSS